MNLMSPRSLAGLLGDTFRDPRGTFHRLQSLDLARETLWQALLLVVILSILLAEVANLYLRAITGPLPEDGGMAVGFLSPFTFGVMQLGVLVATVFLIHWVGRKFQGTGRLADAILAVTWIQFVMVCLQVVQGILLVLYPPLAAIATIAGLAVFFWLLTQFVAALHEFDNLGRVFAMILFVLLGVALGLSFLLTLAGVTVSR